MKISVNSFIDVMYASFKIMNFKCQNKNQMSFKYQMSSIIVPTGEIYHIYIDYW